MGFDAVHQPLPASLSASTVHHAAICRHCGMVQRRYLIGSEQAGKDHGLTPRARIVAAAPSGGRPDHHAHVGPMPATRKAPAKAGLG